MALRCKPGDLCIVTGNGMIVTTLEYKGAYELRLPGVVVVFNNAWLVDRKVRQRVIEFNLLFETPYVDDIHLTPIAPNGSNEEFQKEVDDGLFTPSNGLVRI